MRKMDELTQMPPVLRKRKPCQRILRRDPELQGLHTTNFVFTDVSFGYHEHVCDNCANNESIIMLSEKHTDLLIFSSLYCAG